MTRSERMVNYVNQTFGFAGRTVARTSNFRRPALHSYARAAYREVETG